MFPQQRIIFLLVGRFISCVRLIYLFNGANIAIISELSILLGEFFVLPYLCTVERTRNQYERNAKIGNYTLYNIYYTMSTQKQHLETIALHAGQVADPTTDSCAVPIYQTASYVFHNAQHAADRFGLRDAGNIYGRLTNSTQGVLEERIAALEGGVAALAVASGAAAITYSLQNILQAGDHVVAADNLYGGSYNLTITSSHTPSLLQK